MLLCCTVCVVSHRPLFLPVASMQGCGDLHLHISHNAALLHGLTFSVHAFPTSQVKIRSLCSHGFLFCCLATSQICAVLLHQVSTRRRLQSRCTLCVLACHWQHAGFSGSACAVICSKFLTCSMFLCSYYINPLSWTLYGIIVTQLGDETNLVSAGNQPEPAVCMHLLPSCPLLLHASSISHRACQLALLSLCHV